jgi:hypothetical protein
MIRHVFTASRQLRSILKGFLAFHNRPFPPSHDLERLAQLAQSAKPTPRLSMPEIVGLTDYAVKLRYDHEFWPTQTDAAQALEVAEQSKSAILAVLPQSMRP